MPETVRTTVTLSDITMKQVNELVGVFGNSAASVISKIVEHFFDYGRFDDILERLRAKKRELYPPDEKIIEQKIIKILKAANDIPFTDFVEYLKVDKQYGLDNIYKWAEKFNISLINNKIKKD